MKIALLSAALLFSSFLLLSCKKDNPVIPPPPEPPESVSLSLVDVSCTEAWIKLTTANISLPAEVALLKDGNPAGTISLVSADTILYIDSLLPIHTYKYQSVIQLVNPPAGGAGQKSNLLDVATMDTTSHNFTWQSWTFGGQAGSCTLYDVAIINENDIWAVGEIYLLDTLGQPDPRPYNLARWDGFNWKLDQIPFEYNGSNYYGPIYSIYPFSDSDIWLGIGSMIHWDGTKFNSIKIPDNIFPSRANKLWGTSSNDLYVVGNSGNIAHYDGQSWSKILTGTELNINDIYGAYNNSTNEWEILAVASDYPESIDTEILHLRNNNCTQISAYPIGWPLFSVWFMPGRLYFVAGSGIYQKHLLENNEWANDVLEITTFTTTSITGNDINDVVAVGAYGDLVHFSGVSWESNYDEPLLSNGSYTRVAVKGDLLVAVGGNYVSINSEAVILMGRR